MPDFQVFRKIFGYPDFMYNCSGKTADEWEATGVKWPFLGMLLAVMGTIYIVGFL